MTGRIDDHPLKGPCNLPQKGINFIYTLDGVTKKLHTDGPVVLIGREDLHPVAPDPEGIAVEIIVVAGILHGHQPAQHDVPHKVGPWLEFKTHLQVVFGGAQTKDARYARHHNHVAPGQYRPGGRMAQSIDHFVDRGIFFNVGIGSRQVGLRLVVVVVADKILNSIVRKDGFELLVKLGS